MSAVEIGMPSTSCVQVIQVPSLRWRSTQHRAIAQCLRNDRCRLPRTLGRCVPGVYQAHPTALRRLPTVSIVGSGTVTRCDVPGCKPDLTVPLAVVDETADTKRRWAEGEGWTSEEPGWDRCSIHSGNRVDERPEARR
jgi:hypothetical protein